MRVEPIKDRITDHVVDVPVPHTRHGTVEVLQVVPVKCIKDLVADHVVVMEVKSEREDFDAGDLGETDLMVAWLEIVNADDLGETDRIAERLEVVDSEVPNRSTQRIVEHVVDFSEPQAVEESSDVVNFILQDSITKGIGQQIVDVPMTKHFQECAEEWG